MTSRDEKKRLFVTVGTTAFDALIETVTSREFQFLAYNAGFTDCVIQYGRGSDSYLEGAQQCYGENKLCYSTYAFKPSLKKDILEADMVIGHAGAATALETLRAEKPLIMVVNEELMGNHQWELADELKAKNYALTATPATLCDTFATACHWNPSPFPSPNLEFFDRAVSELLGVSLLH